MTDRVLTPLRVKHVESPWYNHVVLMDDAGTEVVPTLQMVVSSHERLRAERDLLRAAMRAMDELWPQAFAGRWCDTCRSGCDNDSDDINHWPECKRKAYEVRRAAVDAFDKEG